MDNNNLVAQAVRLALVAGMAGVVSVSPTYAQDEVAVQEKITVTGSRISRAQAEGPAPISVISREDIDASGQTSVAEVLRQQTYNTFGSPTPLSGYSMGSGISLRGLGDHRTLVLIDGRRLAGHSGTDLTMIPLAAVERFEILRDGASAIYGSDALAGVVNIILRKDYEGLDLGWTMGRPDDPGGDEDHYSLVGGVTGAKGNITFSFENQKKELVWSKDRDYLSGSDQTSVFGFPGSYWAYLTTDDPRNPTGTYLSIGTFPDPRCPAAIGTDPDFPWSVEEGSRCRYAYWGASAETAELDLKSFFLNANYELNETTEFFTRGMFSYNEKFGRYAASPATSYPTISQDNPNNPTNPANPTNYRGEAFTGQSVEVDTDGDGVPDTVVDGPFDVSTLYRNVPGGHRDRNLDETLVDYLAGVRGTTNHLGGLDWEFAGQWSQVTGDGRSSGLFLAPTLQSEIDSGHLDIFAVNGPTDPNAASSGAITATRDSRERTAAVDGTVSFDAYQFGNGPLPVVLGFEYKDLDYSFDIDEQSAAGNVTGQGTGLSESAGRVVKSLFAEMVIPVLPSMEVNLAARYDDYNDFGTTTNPKVGIAFRPLDTLLLRGTWGQGFMAPDFGSLYSAGSIDITTQFTIDSWRCSLTPEDEDGDGRADIPYDDLPQGHACRDDLFNITSGGNRDLQPERSDQWTLGFSWSPTPDFSITLDYYNIEIDDEITGAHTQRLLDDELKLRQAGASGEEVGRITRGRNNFIGMIDSRTINLDKIETNGVDADVTYSFGVGVLGDFNANLQWTHVNEFKEDLDDGWGPEDLAGSVARPEDRGQLTVSWNLGDFSAAVIGKYISSRDNSKFFDDIGRDQDLPSWTTWDVQATYTTPWNGLVTVGARNALDKDPPTFGHGGYTPYHQNPYGRIPYVRLEQSF